jgi:hypothetical protein
MQKVSFVNKIRNYAPVEREAEPGSHAPGGAKVLPQELPFIFILSSQVVPKMKRGLSSTPAKSLRKGDSAGVCEATKPLSLRNCLEERGIMVTKSKRKPREKRLPITVTAYYDSGHGSTAGSPEQLLAGTVRDISDFGICLFTRAPLHSGDRITVFCRDIWDEEKSGTVVWCNALDLRAYKVGVTLN